MPAETYKKVISVLSQPPDKRKDFEITNLLPWFRKKTDLFRDLKQDILFDLVKHCQLERKKKDELVITQGEQGDCMYILLSGQVTIYIYYTSKENADEDKEKARVINASPSGHVDREALGTYVCSLGQGATFGEVALLSDDCIRTASIISDQTTDLFVVDRDLYNRSVKAVLAKEFEDKANFVSRCPFFSNWPPKYKKQLSMALQKEIFPYERVLTKQGDPVAGIYFILRGEVKLMVEPQQHHIQYPRCFGEERSLHALLSEEGQGQSMGEILSKNISGKDSTHSSEVSHRRRPSKRQIYEICYLGQYESIGDMEILLDLGSYMETTICATKVEVLFLENKHYERLLVKRNPQAIDAMRENLELRMRTRTSKHIEKIVPMMSYAINKAQELNEKRQEQNGIVKGINKPVAEKPSRSAADFNLFVPPNGPLINMFGPGTVFYRIRQREHQRFLRSTKGGKGRSRAGNIPQQALPVPAANNGTAGNEPLPGSASQENSSDGSESQNSLFPPPMEVHVVREQPRQQVLQDAIDYQTSDPVLTRLENRMRAWLSYDGTQKTPRIAKLARSYTHMEAPELKPGVKVVVRSRQGSAKEHDSSSSGADDEIVNGQAWVRNQIGINPSFLLTVSFQNGRPMKVRPSSS